jgi:hypothetical protein
MKHKDHMAHHEHAPKDGMIDNRMVHNDRKAGIERVIQRGPMPKGQGGKMHNAPNEHAQWGSEHASLTPRRG